MSIGRICPEGTRNLPHVGASEEVLGRALKDFGPGRDRIMIATKVFYPIGDDPNDPDRPP